MYTPAHTLVLKTPIKCMQHSLQKMHICTYLHTCIRIHMHTNTHAHAWHCPHAEVLIRRPTIYVQICIHIHIHMYINAQMYKYIHTYIYIHMYMSAHIYTYTYTRTHRQNVHMNSRKHAWNDGRQRTREAPLQTQEALHVSFVRRNETTFRTSNARTSLYPLPETQIPLHSPSPLPNILQNSSRTAGKRSFTVLHWSDEQSV